MGLCTWRRLSGRAWCLVLCGVVMESEVAAEVEAAWAHAATTTWTVGLSLVRSDVSHIGPENGN
jgi:hypothetical protein